MCDLDLEARDTNVRSDTAPGHDTVSIKFRQIIFSGSEVTVQTRISKKIDRWPLCVILSLKRETPMWDANTAICEVSSNYLQRIRSYGPDNIFRTHARTDLLLTFRASHTPKGTSRACGDHGWNPFGCFRDMLRKRSVTYGRLILRDALIIRCITKGRSRKSGMWFMPPDAWCVRSISL
jgi:hypothetical protein